MSVCDTSWQSTFSVLLSRTMFSVVLLLLSGDSPKSNTHLSMQSNEKQGFDLSETRMSSANKNSRFVFLNTLQPEIQ